MALNKLNYNFQPIDFKSGLGELVGNFREGQKMREEREKYGQEKEGRGYGNMIKAAEALYAPQNQANNARVNQVAADFAQPNAEQALELGALKNETARINNATQGESNLAEIKQKLAAAREHAAKAGLDEQTLKFAQEAVNKFETANPEYLDLEDIDSWKRDYSLPANERLLYAKNQSDAIKEARSGVKVIKTVDRLKKIAAEHPEMAEDFNKVLLAAGAGQEGLSGALKSYASSFFGDKHKKALIQEFGKLSNDLIANDIDAQSQRTSDYRATFLAGRKPSADLMAEANQYVLDQIGEEYAPYEPYLNTLHEANHLGVIIPHDKERYRGRVPKSQRQAKQKNFESYNQQLQTQNEGVEIPALEGMSVEDVSRLSPEQLDALIAAEQQKPLMTIPITYGRQ